MDRVATEEQDLFWTYKLLKQCCTKSDRHAVEDIYTNAQSLKTFELSIIDHEIFKRFGA